MFGREIRGKLKELTKLLGKFFGFCSPNTYTILALIVGILAAYFIYIGQFLIATIGILVSGFLDYIDGAVAKTMRKETKFGAMLDSVVDKITEIAIYFSLAFYSINYYFGSFFAASSFMLSSYISKHAGAIGAKMGEGLMERKERYILILIGLICLSFEIDIMAYILYTIGLLSLFTALQRMERTRRFLSKVERKIEQK